MRILGIFSKAIRKETKIPRIFVTDQRLRAFHILDSLPNSSSGNEEASRLQTIFLKHFDNVAFKRDRIACNVARVIAVALYSPLINPKHQVPCQPNGTDCGCFLIYFAKKFLSDPIATLALIKVVLSISFMDFC